MAMRKQNLGPDPDQQATHDRARKIAQSGSDTPSREAAHERVNKLLESMPASSGAARERAARK